jgi:hypothetical protein
MPPTKPATKATPTAPAAPTRTDFGGLSVVDATLPKGQRASKYAENPFVEWLSESKKTGTGKAITVPASDAPRAVLLIRNAANRLKIGSRVVVTDSKGEVISYKTPADLAKLDGSLKILFEGKERKQSVS